MPHVHDDGADIWYETTGAGPALVLTGGFGLLGDQFVEARPLLTDRFTTVDWHHRGAGLSTRGEPATDASFDRWVDDLDAVLTHLDVTDAVLWGTSTGSPITIAYAARHPERVRAVVAHPFITADAATRRVFDGFGTAFASMGAEAMAVVSAWVGGARGLDESLIPLAAMEAESFRRNVDTDHLLATLAELGRVDVAAELASLEAPVLFLVGRDGRMGVDGPGPRRGLDAAVELLPDATTALVPGGGTYCMIEEPQAAVDALCSFVDTLGPVDG